MPPVIKKFDVLGAYDSAGLRGRSCRSIALSSEKVKPGVATRWPNTSPNPSRKGTVGHTMHLPDPTLGLAVRLLSQAPEVVEPEAHGQTRIPSPETQPYSILGCEQPDVVEGADYERVPRDDSKAQSS
ncbi:MAG: hypothetical protein DMG61_07830 [Acidobacteria bacterium]|nr:MAG: hypothetical protein DMG61_07830 [Acidobacteriota bacterium]